MKSSFYYGNHSLGVAKKVMKYINSLPEFLSPEIITDTRAIGGAIEKIISKELNSLLGDWCSEYSNEFGRKAMADIAFKDKEGFYSIIDIKTHREDTSFNMPNLTSVHRLSQFYESDKSIFVIMMVKYSIEKTRLTVTKIIFLPIEYLDWSCLRIGALGWGQIQLSNSNLITINNGYSRKKWMLQLCDVLDEFYPKEITKINERIHRFSEVKDYWNSKEDIWSE